MKSGGVAEEFFSIAYKAGAIIGINKMGLSENRLSLAHMVYEYADSNSNVVVHAASVTHSRPGSVEFLSHVANPLGWVVVLVTYFIVISTVVLYLKVHLGVTLRKNTTLARNAESKAFRLFAVAFNQGMYTNIFHCGHQRSTCFR